MIKGNTKKIIILLLVTLLSSCLFYKKVKTALSEENIRKISALFNHQRHFTYFEANSVKCIYCHPFESLKNVPQEKRTEVTEKIFSVRYESCHFCHRGETAVKNFACTNCHADVSTIKPAYHGTNFTKRHQFNAKTGQSECNQCHVQKFCIDCHVDRDKINQKVHDRNYRFYHSVEARANPRRCDSCHSANYCITCHTQENKIP